MLYAYTTLTHLHKQTRNACSEKGMELVSLLFLLCIFFDMFNVSTRSCKRRPSRCLMMGIDWAQFMWTPPFVLRLLNERRLSFARWWLSCLYHDSPFGQSCNRSSSLLFFFLATGWTWFRERWREKRKETLYTLKGPLSCLQYFELNVFHSFSVAVNSWSLSVLIGACFFVLRNLGMKYI